MNLASFGDRHTRPEIIHRFCPDGAILCHIRSFYAAAILSSIGSPYANGPSSIIVDRRTSVAVMVSMYGFARCIDCLRSCQIAASFKPTNLVAEESSLLIVSVHTFNTSSFITTYFPIPFFAVLFFVYKFWNKSKMINYADMGLITGSSMDIPEEVRLNRDSDSFVY